MHQSSSRFCEFEQDSVFLVQANALLRLSLLAGGASKAPKGAQAKKAAQAALKGVGFGFVISVRC